MIMNNLLIVEKKHLLQRCNNLHTIHNILFNILKEVISNKYDILIKMFKPNVCNIIDNREESS